MIVQITGNIKYPITLDPTVWIFDDRKVILEEAFSNKQNDEKDSLKMADRWSQEIYHAKIRPPVNKSINRFEREKILKNSYVMPIKEFLSHAEIYSSANNAVLKTINGDISISLSDLQASFLLFANKGQPLKGDGPVHMYFGDGSNIDSPIKGVQEIKIK